MDVARLHRNLDHILLDLQRAVERYTVTEATSLQTTWNYEVLKAHQYRRHRRPGRS
ncbi:hypothetical protein ACIRPQ_00710 [Streptomyces sp. NPDC101213]|uniref:hypothetical protein n=1 Tax=Streptomyces sp. NPDC101213 TaxID=3366130 RepID=UPI003821BAC4